MPFISFIVGFRNRDVERVQIFLKSLSLQTDSDFELIFVDYGSDVELSKKIEPLVAKYQFAKYYFFNSRGQNWNRSKCLNYAFSKANGSYIFTADIDFVFINSFVSSLKNTSVPAVAKYFSFGYLSQKYSQSIDLTKTQHPTEEYSAVDTIGALLLSREIFSYLNGYDEFYEIWGVEDNDILKRIQLSSYKVEFCADKNLIWHIWHLPAKKADVLPEGWLRFLGDYYTNKFADSKKHSANHFCEMDNTRPIISKLDNCICINDISYNPHFLLIYMRNELLQMTSNDVICFKFKVDDYLKYSNSNLNKLVLFLNISFNKLNLPVTLSNKNMIAFTNEKQIRDALQYFIKYNHHLLKDHYLADDIMKQGFYIMKK
jgi:glycosyltransferase involved in cell wall biosynthesis